MLAQGKELQVDGCLTALITPFRDGKVDEKAFCDFVEWQINQGVHGLVPCGTTGESATLSEREYGHVIKMCVEVADGRVPVIAGSGSNSTDKTIHYSKIAQDAGADALLVVTPYYNKPSQEGLLAHFTAVHDATRIPIVLYDIPPRSIVPIEVSTMQALAQLPRIIGVKDATSDLAKPLRISKACGADFWQLSGDDATSLAFNIQGGRGCISVTSNIAPRLCAEMQNAFFEGRIKEAMRINESLQPLRDAVFCQSSPGPLKFGAELLGICSRDTRLPIVPASPEAQRQMKAAMEDLALSAEYFSNQTSLHPLAK
jgi:4-hydroxy-tetrahydrodipicolinate synthase